MLSHDQPLARAASATSSYSGAVLPPSPPSHLRFVRMGPLRQQALLIERTNGLDDFDAKVNIMLEFMLPDKPFASFIAAYVKGRFPIFERVFGR